MPQSDELKEIIESKAKEYMVLCREGFIQALATAILNADYIKMDKIGVDKLLLEADSMLSYIRYRCEVSKMGQLTYAEIDDLIGRLRRTYTPSPLHQI